MIKQFEAQCFLIFQSQLIVIRVLPKEMVEAQGLLVMLGMLLIVSGNCIKGSF